MAGKESVELLFVTLHPEAKADDALRRLIEMNRSGTIELISAMVLAKDEQGDVGVEDTPDLLKEESPFKDVLSGSPGGLFSKIGGVLADAMAGAALGLAARPVARVGVKEQHLKQLGQELSPGETALLALVEEEAAELVVRELGAVKSDVRRFVLQSEGPAGGLGDGG